MPPRNLGAVTYGAAYGLFLIGWITFGAIFLLRNGGRWMLRDH
jgi:L-lactate permease